MYTSPLALLGLFLPISVFGVPTWRARSGALDSKVPSSDGTGTFTLQDKYIGEDFLTKWDFFTGTDPTNGTVNYLSHKDAISKGLATASKHQAILAVDSNTTLASGEKRDSVRISSKKTYNGGLFIADFKAMPFGCSIWPAWWSVGPGWPAGGEIDVIEGANTQKTNQMTLHTSAECSLQDSGDTSQLFSGTAGSHTSCTSSHDDNSGCGITDVDPQSYGDGFNKVGGGVYAHLWDPSIGIKIWRWTRSQVPSDITSGSPDPESWGTPAGFWANGASCDIASHFQDHVLTIDTTICGDWAGSAYESSGCPGTCADAVADPKNFVDAKWVINSIAVYNSSSSQST